VLLVGGTREGPGSDRGQEWGRDAQCDA
jgi:hypothetical protein